MRDERGEPLEIVGFWIDITKRKETEEALRQSDQNLRSMIEGSSDGIVVVTEGQIVFSNSAAAKMLGHISEEILGKSPLDFVHPDDRARAAQRISELLEMGKDDADTRTRMYRSLGTDREFPGEVVSTPITFEGKRAILSTVRDVTERRKAEEELGLRTKELEKANAVLTRAHADLEAFSHLLAHDLRGSLITVSNYSTLLSQDVGGSLDQEHRRRLDRIVSAAKGSIGIIDGLRDLTFLAREGLKQELDLSMLAKEIIEELRRLEPNRSVEFEAEHGLIAKGDPDHMRLLLANLLQNAWKFTVDRDPARIHLGAERRRHDRLVYYVRDNGVGFANARSEELFKPFQRLHSNQEFEGTGLGLTTVQRVVNRYGGEVWAESTEGEGATFRFTLGT